MVINIIDCYLLKDAIFEIPLESIDFFDGKLQ